MSAGDVIELQEAAGGRMAAQNQLAATPAQLLQIAVSQGADLDKMERLMAMQERWEANQAAKQYAEAMAAFKAADGVRIVKDKHVRFQSQKGITEYDHATIGNVVKVITEALAPHGLSHSWTTRQEGNEIHVTCKLRHRGGHFEEVTLSGNPDASGGKNPIQAIGSTVTYLQRYTLLLITGCATSDQPDDDGQTGGGDPVQEARNEWIVAAKSAPDRTELGRVAKAGAKAFQQAKDRYGYAEFAKAVQARGAELGGPEGGAA